MSTNVKHKVCLFFNENRQDEKFAYDILSRINISKTSYVTSLIIKDLKARGVDLSAVLSDATIGMAELYANAGVGTGRLEPPSSMAHTEEKVSQTPSPTATTPNSLPFSSLNETHTNTSQRELGDEEDDFDRDAYLRDVASIVENFGQ